MCLQFRAAGGNNRRYESIMGHDSARISEVWREVEAWPVRTRLTLASRILESVERTLDAPDKPSEERRKALQSLIGIWTSPNPPSDQDVQQIVEEERLKRFG